MAKTKITNKGNRTQRLLIEAATQLIAARGEIGKISLRDIARQAGVTPSMVVYHFGTKENLIATVRQFLIDNRCSNPVAQYLNQNRVLLESEDGKAAFISGMIDHFCLFFKKLPGSSWSESLVYRILLHSGEEGKQETAADQENYSYFEGDMMAFYEIYRLITGKDDFDMAYFWFSTTLVPLAIRFSRRNLNVSNPLDLRLSPGYDQRFIFFCRARLLAGLGLAECEEAKVFVTAVQREIHRMYAEGGDPAEESTL
ncbi:MAG: TetR family transcriptional regulator [Victivallaceae bacterium]|nr:TetR family transcriptional regulator [Victivallaceae bacterium]